MKVSHHGTPARLWRTCKPFRDTSPRYGSLRTAFSIWAARGHRLSFWGSARCLFLRRWGGGQLCAELGSVVSTLVHICKAAVEFLHARLLVGGAENDHTYFKAATEAGLVAVGGEDFPPAPWQARDGPGAAIGTRRGVQEYSLPFTQPLSCSACEPHF